MNKLIISALLIFGLVGMIGTAAATPVPTSVSGLIYDQSNQLVNGTVVTVHAGPSCSDPTLPTSSSYVVSGAGGLDGYYLMGLGDLESSAVITVCAVHPTKGSGTATTTAGSLYSGTVNVAIQDVQIPEFPTIALPIAAILGLMFIISSRKKEE